MSKFLTTGRPDNWRGLFPADCDERWRAAQLADAKNGIYWGKYGRVCKARVLK
jgi:hypothetical protein